MPKSCGHFMGKLLMAKDEMLGKLKAAPDARHDQDLVKIAPTDARTAVGFDDALARAHAYAEAGADVFFFSKPTPAGRAGGAARKSLWRTSNA